MSTSITLTTAAPTLAALRDRIAAPALVVEGDDDPAGPMAIGVHHFWLDGISTRATEVTVGEREVAVRIFSLASPADVALATSIVTATAALTGVAIADAELFGEVEVAQLPAIFDRAWADQQAESGAQVLQTLIADGRGPIAVPGPRREFHLGPRVLAELAADGPPASLPTRLLARLHAVQWLPARTAAIFEVTRHDGHRSRLSPWLGDEVVIPAVAHVAITDDSGGARSVFVIEQPRVAELAGPRWRWIDERQGHVADMGADWPATVAAARAFAISL